MGHRPAGGECIVQPLFSFELDPPFDAFVRHTAQLGRLEGRENISALSCDHDGCSSSVLFLSIHQGRVESALLDALGKGELSLRPSSDVNQIHVPGFNR